MTKARIEAKIKGLGKIYRADAPFDEALKALKRKRAKIISSRDLAYARMHEGGSSSLCLNGSYVREGDISIPKQKGEILIKNSLILKSPEQATQARGEGKEFFIDKKQAMKYLEKAKNSEDNSTILITDFTSIPTNTFGNDKLTAWLFEDQAKEYGLFLKENKIDEMSLYFDDQDYVDSQEESYANQLWLCFLDSGSDLNGKYRLFNYYYPVRGVLKGTGKASSHERLYTNKQVDIATRIIFGVREGKLPASKLEKVLDFLRKLKE
jgi:hypothetical protein